MGRPIQDVRILDVQDRRKSARNKSPFVVRRVVEGKEKSTSFATRGLADHYRSRLLVAHRDGERFDRSTGEPASWAPSAGDQQLHAWVREWLASEWLEWQPKTRNSHVEALARFVPLVRASNAPEPPARLRTYLFGALRPAFDAANIDDACELWLDRWSLPMGELDRALLAKVETALALRLDGSRQLGSATARRYRKSCRACIRRAFDLQKILVDPWPPEPRGRSRRKVARIAKKAVDVRRLPDPEKMAAVLEQMPSHQPASRTYQLMSAVIYYAGLRPGEVVMLRPRALTLPESGWGRIEVTEADIDYDEPGDPKEGERLVPIPPVLVAMLRQWLAEHRIGRNDLLFRSRTGRRPHPSNWGRCLKRASAACGAGHLYPYTLRHAAATTWLKAGVPLGEVSSRLGNSVETLVATYVGALEGDEQMANNRIDAVLAPQAAPTDSGPTTQAA